MIIFDWLHEQRIKKYNERGKDYWKDFSDSYLVKWMMDEGDRQYFRQNLFNPMMFPKP